MEVIKWGRRQWALVDSQKRLVAVFAYKKGAQEVQRRLLAVEALFAATVTCRRAQEPQE